jgi:hypothetical protein
MGKSKKPTIGYWYSLGLLMGVCLGPVDKFLKIVAGGILAWSGEVTESTTFPIRKRDLFGGETKEGGIDGLLSVCMGEPDQQPHDYLVGQLGSPQPARRGKLTLVWHGIVGAMNPYVKAWSFQVARYVVGWRTPVWEPDLCQVDKGMNGAHFVYRAVTDPNSGLGLDPEVALDLVRHKAAAQILHDERLGLCLKWSQTDVVNNFIGVVCDHVGGEFSTDPSTGKQFLRLYRGGYDINTLPVVDESNIIELSSHEQSSLYGSVNTITCTYRDCETNKDASVTVHNPANIQAQGGQVIPNPISRPGFWNSDLAIRGAMRELHAVSSLPARGKMKLPTPLFAMVNGTLQEVEVIKGDILAFSWKLLFLVKMPIRVLEIDRGSPTDNAIQITYTTDVNALPTQNYVVGQPSLWIPTDTTPLPVPDQRLVESSYRDLAGTLSAGDMAQLTTESAYVGSLGVRPSNIAYNYTLKTRVGDSGDFIERTNGDFTPTGLLPFDISPGSEPLTFILASPRALDLVEVGSEAVCGDEVLRVDAINADTSQITLARGCVDTVPAFHAAGTRVWFTDDYTGADPTEYLSGETVEAKLLTRTTAGQLDEAFAPIATAVMNRRQIRPYPPGNLLVAGSRYPTAANGQFSVSWSHRDRLLQADQLIDTLQGDIGPEPGTTYTVRCRVAGTGEIVFEAPGIADTTALINVGYSGDMLVEVVSVRDGYESYQALAARLIYTAAPPSDRVTDDGSYRRTDDGSRRATE